MSLAIQNRVLVLRSVDGTGDNNSKTFDVNWGSTLPSAFTHWLCSSKFVSKTGDFSGNSCEVRWDLSVVNQIDTIIDQEALCLPHIYQDVDGTGALVGSVMISQFAESIRVYLNTPTRPTLTITIHDMDGELIEDMTEWILILSFEPVLQRTRGR